MKEERYIMAKYYIIDWLDTNFVVKKTNIREFYEALLFNYSVAEENGDKVPNFVKMKCDFALKANHEESFNGFSFLKLTNKTLREWGY